MIEKMGRNERLSKKLELENKSEFVKEKNNGNKNK